MKGLAVANLIMAWLYDTMNVWSNDVINATGNYPWMLSGPIKVGLMDYKPPVGNVKRSEKWSADRQCLNTIAESIWPSIMLIGNKLSKNAKRNIRPTKKSIWHREKPDMLCSLVNFKDSPVKYAELKLKYIILIIQDPWKFVGSVADIINCLSWQIGNRLARGGRIYAGVANPSGETCAETQASQGKSARDNAVWPGQPALKKEKEEADDRT